MQKTRQPLRGRSSQLKPMLDGPFGAIVDMVKLLSIMLT